MKHFRAVARSSGPCYAASIAMLAPTSLAARVVTFSLSASVHAAVALVAVGAHSGNPGGAPAAERLIEVDAPEPIAPPPLAEGAPAKVASTGHTHPYAVPANHDAIPHDPSLVHPHVTVADSLAMAPVAAPPAVVDAPAAAPRFTMTVGAVGHAAGGVTSVSGAAMPGNDEEGQPVAEAAVDRQATLVAGSAPAYTPPAEAAGVEADVPLEIVLDAQGKVVAARVLKSVGYGLDEAALHGIRGYRFSPALRGGRAVAVRMRWLMRFQLR